jgi:2-polyprenyl-6-methoxyphenol hydroxylase-like FAD-dependent oxidoreductase
MPTPLRVAVIGGGIGGLTAARALLRPGFEVSVSKAAHELRQIGAGVALGPNAMKALRSLGPERSARVVAWESENQLLRNWRSGRIISRTPRRGYLLSRFGATGSTAHRADLLDVLAAHSPNGIVNLSAGASLQPATTASHRLASLTGARSKPTWSPALTASIQQCEPVWRTRRASPASSAGAIWCLSMPFRAVCQLRTTRPGSVHSAPSSCTCCGA